MNKWNSLQGKLPPVPGKCWTESETHLDWIVGSHLTTLCINNNNERQHNILHEIREKSKLSTFPRTEESPRGGGRGGCYLAAFPGLPFTDLNLQIPSWETNYSDGYSNIPQMNQKVKSSLTP